jgi:hypothetical protein
MRHHLRQVAPTLLESAINAVHNDFEYSPPACWHLVKLDRQGFTELQGSSMLQPHQVTVFPAEHMVPIVMYGLRPDASKHQIRVCACLAAQLAFFSRADSGHQRESLQHYVIHQPSNQECRSQSSGTLFESVLSSRRSRQLLHQTPAPMENSTEPQRHRSVLVL